MQLWALFYLVRNAKNISRLLENIPCQDSEIQAMYRYAIAGGQRARPLLLLLACEAVGSNTQDVLPAAMAIELAHKASCIHDDLTDGDTYRRGHLTFAKRYGASQALVTGDMLISLGYDMLGLLNVPSDIALQCNRLYTRAFKLMASGQLKDLIFSGDRSVSFEESLQMLTEKTAPLLELALNIGSLLGGGTPDQITALSAYGRTMGLAFQLMNDLNDFSGTELSEGRAGGSDLYARRKTPLICYALQKAEPSVQRRLDRLLRADASVEKGALEEMRSLVVATGAPGFIEMFIGSLLAQARQQLEALPESKARAILELLTDRVFFTKKYFSYRERRVTLSPGASQVKNLNQGRSRG